MNHSSPSPLALVHEFMQAFGRETPEKPCAYEPPSLEIRALRAKLILEEALEAVRALGFGVMYNEKHAEYPQLDNQVELELKDIQLESLYEYNFIECLDALCDLEYVGPAGTAVALGISKELFEKAFKLVHESNMRKLWTEDEIGRQGGILLPLQVHKIGDSRQIQTKEKLFYKATRVTDNLWLVKDKSGKIIKSPSWTKPNLEGLLGA